MAKQLSRSTDRQKGRSRNFALVVFSILRHLTVIHSTRDGAQPFPRGLWLDSGGEGESRGQGQKITEDLRRECFSRYLDLFGIKRMLIIRLSYLQSIDVKPRRSSRYSWNK